MRTSACLLSAGLVLAHAVALPPVLPADPPAAGGSCPNAAVVYWQAFAALPALEGDRKARFDAANTSMTGPVADDLQPVVAEFAAALDELHRGSAVAGCDWNLDYGDGPAMRLSHLDKARSLARAALLRARLRFAAGATDDALADVLATLKLARDCGSSPVMVSVLVDGSIEAMASDVLAANLGRLSPKQLDDLSAALSSLPPTPSMAECIRLEGRIFGEWLEKRVAAEAAGGGQRKVGAALLELFEGTADGDAGRRELLASLNADDARGMLRLVQDDFAEAATLAGLPPTDRRGRWSDIESRLTRLRTSTRREDKVHGLVSEFLPAVDKALEREDRIRVRRELLKLAVEARRRGPGAIGGATIAPHGPVDYRKTEAGFDLSCRPDPAAEPEILRVAETR